MPSYLHEDDPLPERTTPQGTQANGVEHGHEERDVDFRALTKWFIGLAVGLAIILPAVSYAFKFTRPLIEGGDGPTSQVFAQRWDLPQPRVLPNPFDAPPDQVVPLPQRLLDPARYLVQERRAEDEALVKLGLRYPDDFDDASRAGLPRLPDQAADAVIAKAGGADTPPGPAGAVVQQLIPSGASGGTRMENRLR
jgi:hypothetical protein